MADPGLYLERREGRGGEELHLTNFFLGKLVLLSCMLSFSSSSNDFFFRELVMCSCFLSVPYSSLNLSTYTLTDFWFWRVLETTLFPHYNKGKTSEVELWEGRGRGESRSFSPQALLPFLLKPSLGCMVNVDMSALFLLLTLCF